MRVLVTGANGFIGAALSRRLLSDGVSVRAMCRTLGKGDTLRQQGAEVVQGDLQLIDSLRRGVEGCEVVYHIGAALEGTAAYQYNVSVLGTLNLLQAAHEAGVRRFVHISSIAVYGNECFGFVREDQPRRPSRRDYYQQAKSLAEDVLWEFAAHHDMEVTCLRPGMVYGPESGFWTRNMFNAFSRYPVPIIGDGGGHAHPIYIDDVVDLMVALGYHPAAVGLAFNCAPDPAPTWVEFVGHYARMAGNTCTLPVSPALLRGAALITPLTALRGKPLDLGGFLNFLIGRTTYSMARAKERLGWQARVPLAEGMAHAERWLQQIGAL